MHVAFIWELGGGLGHLGRQIPVAKRMRSLGHRVTFFVPQRYLDHSWLDGFDLEPTVPPLANRQGIIRSPNSFQDSLWNLGFRDRDWLESMVDQWKSKLNSIAPDLAVLDHSPCALLALFQTSLKVAFVGTGFYIPNDTAATIPGQDYPDRIKKTHRDVLANVNSLLLDAGLPPLDSILQLFDRFDLKLIASYPELDHRRLPPTTTAIREEKYCGVWSERGEPCDWPDWPGPNQQRSRVFIYLNNPVSIANSFKALELIDAQALFFGNPEARQQASALLRSDLTRQIDVTILDRPADIRSIAPECDLAITHAGLGATSQLLTAGIPLVLIPNTGEQAILAQRTVDLGAGLMAHANDGQRIQAAVETCLTSNDVRTAAQTFSAKYQSWDADKKLDEAVQRILALCEV